MEEPNQLYTSLLGERYPEEQNGERSHQLAANEQRGSPSRIGMRDENIPHQNPNHLFCREQINVTFLSVQAVNNCARATGREKKKFLRNILLAILLKQLIVISCFVSLHFCQFFSSDDLNLLLFLIGIQLSIGCTIWVWLKSFEKYPLNLMTYFVLISLESVSLTIISELLSFEFMINILSLHVPFTIGLIVGSICTPEANFQRKYYMAGGWAVAAIIVVSAYFIWDLPSALYFLLMITCHSNFILLYLEKLIFRRSEPYFIDLILASVHYYYALLIKFPPEE